MIHERLSAVEVSNNGELRLCEPNILGDFTLAAPPDRLPAVATTPEVWLNAHASLPFLAERYKDRIAETGRTAAHVKLSLTELLQRADGEIGR